MRGGLADCREAADRSARVIRDAQERGTGTAPVKASPAANNRQIPRAVLIDSAERETFPQRTHDAQGSWA
jgi:hypothetical protein